MNEGDDTHIGIFFQCIFELLRINRLAPRILDDDRDAAGTLDVLDHAAAKNAVAADDNLVAGCNHVNEAELHANRTGAGHREGQLVFGLVDVTQQALEFFHHLDKNRIEIANRRQAHRRHHARIDFRWAGAEQGTLRRVE